MDTMAALELRKSLLKEVEDRQTNNNPYTNDEIINLLKDIVTKLDTLNETCKNLNITTIGIDPGSPEGSKSDISSFNRNNIENERFFIPNPSTSNIKSSAKIESNDLDGIDEQLNAFKDIKE